MMIVTPTLHFQGRCEEAICLYQKAFDLKISHILHYSDADKHDWNIELSEEQKKFVYHSEGYIGGQRFMLADEMEQEYSKATSIFLTITFDTAKEVKQAYRILSEEGTIIYPLRSTTYSSCVGSLIDKFGFRWGLMTEQTDR